MELKPGVFLSHSSDDRDFVVRLAQDLSSCGVHVWIDRDILRIGDELPRIIKDGIDRMNNFAIVLSPSAVASTWVRRECEYALASQDKKVFTLIRSPCNADFLPELKHCDLSDPVTYESQLGEFINVLFVDVKHELYLGLLNRLIEDVRALDEWVNVLCERSNKMHLLEVLGEYDMTDNLKGDTLSELDHQRARVNDLSEATNRLNELASQIAVASTPYMVRTLVSSVEHWHASQFLSSAQNLKSYASKAQESLYSIRAKMLARWSLA